MRRSPRRTIFSHAEQKQLVATPVWSPPAMEIVSAATSLSSHALNIAAKPPDVPFFVLHTHPTITPGTTTTTTTSERGAHITVTAAAPP